jgi:MBG domain/Bacterial Ig-like domain (group 3)
MRGKFTLLFLTIAMLLAIPAVAAFAQDTGTPPAPTIQSDKADYGPGEFVTLTGSGWQPGESVNIVVNDDVGQTWNRNVNVIADPSGNISDSFNLPDWFVATYKVTATGAQSGVVTTTFTDSLVRFTTNLPGSDSTNIAWEVYNNTNCTAPSSLAPPKFLLPGGATASVFGGTPPNLDRVTSTQSVKFTADAASTGNRAFSNWTGPGNPITITNLSPDGSMICTSGFNNGNDIRTFSANYGAAPATVNTTTTASNASATYGDSSVTLDATVTPASGTVNNGSVTFTIKNGTTTVGTVTDNTLVNNSASASFPLANVNAGSYTIEAAYTAGPGFNASNNSTQSQAPTLTVNKANQTITFAAGTPTTKNVGDADFQVNATASSGLTPVTFASSTSGVCTVAGNTVHIVGAGTCTITASQAGNANYNPAPNATHNISIGQANQTITFPVPTGKTFGDADFDPGATASSGLAVSYSSSTPGVCTIVSGKVHVVSAGTCTVTASQAGNANYNPAPNVTRSFSIGAAQGNVTLSNLTQTYDGSAKSVGVTTTPSGLNVSVTYSGNAQAPTNAGSYNVVATINDPNYQGSATGTLKIDKAVLSVDAKDQSTVYGDSNLPPPTT